MPLSDYWFVCPNIPQGFPNFQRLPTELRLKIWQDALPGRRTIHLVNRLSYSPSSYQPKPSNPPPHHCKIKSKRETYVNHCRSTVRCPRELTAMLQTCRESRFEVLSRYQPLFAPRGNSDTLFHLHYFDPSIDGIFVEDIWPWEPFGNSKPTNIFKARHLSISCNAWFMIWTVDPLQLLSERGLLRFKDLQELHIVYRILTDQEREKINKQWDGQHMRPRALTRFLESSNAPHNIAFPDLGVNIRVDEIMAQFKKMKDANPGWNIPKVKLMAWATISFATVNSK